MSNIVRHKVFVSFHHYNDEEYSEQFEELFTEVFDILVSKTVQLGDIDPQLKTETIRQIIREDHLSDSTVTVVLVGEETWKRKHVDWEISASIRDTDANPRSGLLGILLPTYDFPNPNKYNHNTIPPRLYDNLKNKPKYASIHLWNDDPETVAGWIDAAFKSRDTILPDNSRPLFAKNRSGEEWSD